MTPADLIRLFTRHGNAANLLMALMLLAGVVGLQRLNTQFFPTFTVDSISVLTAWPGASASDVEGNIIAAIEPEVRYLDNVKKIVSFAREGQATIVIEYEQGSDMQTALSEVESAVARVTTLPEDAEEPEVIRNAAHGGIMRLSLSGPFSEAALKAIAKRLRDELLARGIDKITLFGTRDEEIHVDVPAERLRQLDLGLGDIAQRIRSQSLDLPSGNVRGARDRQIRSLGLETSAVGVGHIEVRALSSGQKIHLRDIATVREAFDEDGAVGWVNGEPAVELFIQRSVTADALKTAAIVDKYLDETLPTLPPTLKVQRYDVQVGLIRGRINILLVNGVGGLILVLAILFLFLNLRVATWVALGIPVALMATLGVMLLSGQSMNMVSLFGLIMTLGIIVDDAIVVGEHAATRRTAGASALDAAEGGALRMLAPVMASSLTTIAAFLPLFVIGDIIGTIIKAIPFVAVSVLIASLIECFLVLPGHLHHSFLRRQKPDSRFRTRFNARFQALRDGPYRKLVQRAIEWRYLTVASTLAALLICIGLVLGGRLSFTFFPSPESDVVLANLVMAPGTSRSQTKDMVGEVQAAAERAAKKLLPDRALIAATYGSAGQTQGRVFERLNGDRYGGLYLELVPSDDRDIRTAQFIEAWQAEIREHPGVVRLTLTERLGGPPGKDIDVRLSGGSTEALKAAALEVRQVLARFPGVSGIEDDLPFGKQEIVLEVSPRGRALGFSTESLGRQVRHAFEGAIAKRFPRGDEEVTVRVQYPRDQTTGDALENLYLRAADGSEVPLSEVVTVREDRGFDRIRREDGRREVAVFAELDQAKINANRLIETLQQDEYLPVIAERYNLDFRFSGQAENQARTLADMRLGAMIGLVAIYIILCWVFASYSRPVVVMLIIPFGLVGAVIGHLLMGFDLTILSLVGLLGLSGIMVNGSIILVSTIEERRTGGERFRDAIVGGAQDRFRAVLLTSLTTIGGLTPLLFETSLQAQFLKPMALTLVFGLAVATMLVLLVVPALLAIQADIAEWYGGGAGPVRLARTLRGLPARLVAWRPGLKGTQSLIVAIGFWTGVVVLPAMIFTRVYEIVARNLFGRTSAIPQYLEWDLFILLVLLPLGYAYLRNNHVRVDILRERLPEAWRARIELAGLVLFVIPVAVVIIYYGIHMAVESYGMGEKSILFLGASGRWVLKAMLPVGFLILLAAAIVVAVRNRRFLKGRHHRAEPG